VDVAWYAVGGMPDGDLLDAFTPARGHWSINCVITDGVSTVKVVRLYTSVSTSV
jgi:hypothetical protein